MFSSNMSIGVNLIKISVIYLVIGLSAGIYISVANDYTVKSIHAHVNLLGWVTMGLFGVIYVIAGDTLSKNLAIGNFILHNLGLPVMMISIYMATKGNTGVTTWISVGTLTVYSSVILFSINILFNLKSKKLLNR